MRLSTIRTLTPTFLVFMALSACSSDDDAAASGGEDIASGPDGSSMLNPNLQPEGPPSSEPGGDTSAIAGLWDATRQVDTGEDEAYVQISEDGLWTQHDYDQDATGLEQANCYRITGPLTLTPEGGTDYSLAGQDEAWSLSAGNDVLSAQLGDGEAMSWPRTPVEISVEDFEECATEPDDRNRARRYGRAERYGRANRHGVARRYARAGRNGKMAKTDPR